MRIAVTYDQSQNLKPLDEADIIAVIDEEKKEVEQYENPAHNVSKEAAMGIILDLGVDAIVVKKQFLCPGSYMMSQGRIKYIPTEYKTLKEVLDNLETLEKGIKEDLDEEMYAEAFPEE
jgi:predicted Fe-Mo cluster-binding NifX family protein